MIMIHLVRSEYGYQDEYIMKKSISWLHDCVDLILESRHNRDRQLADFVAINISKLLWDKKAEIPSFRNEKKEEKKVQMDDFLKWNWFKMIK